MLALCLMLSVTYYAKNYAGIIGWSLVACGVIHTATELHIYALHPIFYADFNSKCLNR